MSYKERHEQFVSDLTGGPVSEIYTVFFLCVLGNLAWHGVSSKIPSQGPFSCAVDFVFNWAVPLATITVYSSRPIGLLVMLLIPIFLYFPPRSKTLSNKPAGDGLYLPHKTFITYYRSNMMIMTICAILAVDFRVFPRRFAKVETWGTSLMDLGVGSFVFSLGVVSARQILASENSGVKIPLSRELKNFHALKVLALGLLRLTFVKLFAYQEHESEYGTHWNFFMTLGILPPVYAIIRRISPFGMLWTGLIIAVGYEIALKNTELMIWALSAPRTNLISANKEGICSFVGYLAIFIFGNGIGRIVLPSWVQNPEVSKASKTASKGKKVIPNDLPRIIFKLGLISIVTHIIFTILRTETEVSRRLANLPYIVWVVAVNTFLLTIFALLDHIFAPNTPQSYTNVNRLGQKMFLLGNVLTGLVNLAVHTVDAPNGLAVIILLGYEALIFYVSFKLMNAYK